MHKYYVNVNDQGIGGCLDVLESNYRNVKMFQLKLELQFQNLISKFKVDLKK